jgi:hypothetical protein
MRYFGAVIVFFGLMQILFGCTEVQKPDPIRQIGCLVGQSAGQVASQAIAEKLECKNRDAINESIYKALVNLRVCEEKGGMSAKGIGNVARDVCFGFGPMLLDGLYQGAIPSTWGCTPTASRAKLLAVLSVACDKL